jgi:hypothetical protein
MESSGASRDRSIVNDLKLDGYEIKTISIDRRDPTTGLCEAVDVLVPVAADPRLVELEAQLSALCNGYRYTRATTESLISMALIVANAAISRRLPGLLAAAAIGLLAGVAIAVTTVLLLG